MCLDNTGDSSHRSSKRLFLPTIVLLEERQKPFGMFSGSLFMKGGDTSPRFLAVIVAVITEAMNFLKFF